MIGLVVGDFGSRKGQSNIHPQQMLHRNGLAHT